jgi:hypothetical protein
MVNRGDFFEKDEPVERLVEAFAEGYPAVSEAPPATSRGTNETLRVKRSNVAAIREYALRAAVGGRGVKQV